MIKCPTCGKEKIKKRANHKYCSDKCKRVLKKGKHRMKIVINNCYGGFSISRKAAEFMAARGNERARLELEQSVERFYGYGYAAYERTDPDLVAAVEALGEEANGLRASLLVVEIPDDVDWYIEENDGNEWVAETHRTWQ